MHVVVGELTPGNASFLVMNRDCHSVLAMDVIVCTAGVGNVLRTNVYESAHFGGRIVMFWVGICHHGRTQLVFLIPLLCPFCNSETLITSFNMTMQDVTWLVFVKHFPTSITSVFFQLKIYGMNSVEVFATIKIHR